MELHREQDRSFRPSALLSRMETLVDRDEESRQRHQQEDAFATQLGGSQQPQRGAAGQDQRQKTTKQEPEAKVAGEDKFRSQLSQKDRQISASAGQLKQAGFKPDSICESTAGYA